MLREKFSRDWLAGLTGLIFFLQFTSQVDIIGASGCGSAVYNLMMHFAKRPKNCVSARWDGAGSSPCLNKFGSTAEPNHISVPPNIGAESFQETSHSKSEKRIYCEIVKNQMRIGYNLQIGENLLRNMNADNVGTLFIGRDFVKIC